MTKGKSLRGRHLIIIGRANILILIISTNIAILICRSLQIRRGRSGETTEVSLSSWNTIDTGVHLTQLITESIKASIHALKLRHDGLKSHTTIWGRRSRGGRNSRNCTISCLRPWLLRSKLGLTPPNRSCTNGTYNGEVGELGIGIKKNGKESTR